jgi:hypothetical protein
LHAQIKFEEKKMCRENINIETLEKRTSKRRLKNCVKKNTGYVKRNNDD